MRARLLRNAPFVILAAAGVALALYAMRTGVGIRGDSVRYVMGARNLLAGNGFSRLSGGGEVFPETGFAPLLSFLLAGFGALGIDMFDGARVFNAFLFGGSIFLTGLMIAEASRSPWVGLLGAGLVLTAPDVVRWHAWLMSEALFIFLSLLSLFLLVHHIRTGSSGALYLSAVAAGLAGLARYVGVSLVPVGALGILLWSAGSRREKLARAAVFCVVAFLPFALWMARNTVVGGAGVANRQVRFHAVRPEALRVFFFQPTTWLIPEGIVLHRVIRGALALSVLGAGPALLVGRAIRRRSIAAELGQDKGGVLPWLLMIHIPSYVGVLAFNSLFLDAGTTYDGILRYLTPLYVLVVMLVLTAYARALSARRLGHWVLAAALLPLAVNVRETITFAQGSTYAVGFTHIRTEWTDLAARLSAVSPETPIISDNPEVVYFLIDRPAYMIPIKYDIYQQAFREDFLQQVELARTRLESGAVLVIFGEPSEEEAEVLDLLGVPPLFTSDEATVYGYPP